MNPHDKCFQQCDFIVLAINRQDPNPQTPIEAWAYRGPLDFLKATPVTFGQGADIAEALKALESQLLKHENTMNTESLTILLQEQSSDKPPRTITVKLLSEAGKLWIAPEGYGDKTSQDGCGYPIGLEIWEGRLRLIVFDNINCEDPQIIDLEKAQENCRVDADDCQKPYGDDQATISSPDPSRNVRFDERQLATILAALRFHQDENLQGKPVIPDEVINEIATDCGKFVPLGFNEIDALCERLNCESSIGLTISPPPTESGHPPLYRVVYVIDVHAVDAQQAAKETHAIMSDPDAWPPVLETMDHRGHLLRIDLCHCDKSKPKQKTLTKRSQS